jgi:hypothetical protein
MQGAKPQLMQDLAVFAFGKALAVAALLTGLAYYFYPGHAWNYVLFTAKDAGMLLPFINWDGQHYLLLATHGYPVPATPSSAFFPLLPALIALGMHAGLGPIESGLVVVTLASAAVFVLLGRLLPQRDSSPSSLWLFACFPTAFYLSVVYSESLFIALFLGLLWALRDPRRARYAALCAAALPLARGQGFWLAIPIAVAWAALAWRGGRFDMLDRRSLVWASLGYLVGVAAYLAFFGWRYGDPLAGIEMQRRFVSDNSLSHLFDVPRFIEFLITPPTRFFNVTNSGLDKLAILISLSALALSARHSKDPFLLTSWASFAVLPAMMGSGASYARYALLAWLCFVLTVGPELKPWFKWPLVVLGFASQFYLAYCFGANRWVG